MKKTCFLIIFAAVTIMFTGCQKNLPNNESNQNSITENNVPTTEPPSGNTPSNTTTPQDDILTALQILGNISFEQVELKATTSNLDSKKVILTTPEQLEQFKELLNQIKLKKHIGSVDKDPKQIPIGGFSIRIFINNEIEFRMDAAMEIMYINSQPYDSFEFPSELFLQIIETETTQ